MGALDDLVKKSQPKSVSVPQNGSKSALDSLLTSKTTKPQSALDNINTDKIVTKTLPGGGAYKMKVGDPNWKAPTEDESGKDIGHTTYGGLPTKKGFERADTVPVSLSGDNSNPKNIQYEKYPVTERVKSYFNNAVLGKPYVAKTNTDKYIINDLLPQYKTGKISLREAQVKAISYLQDEQDGAHSITNKVGGWWDKQMNNLGALRNVIDKKLSPDRGMEFPMIENKPGEITTVAPGPTVEKSNLNKLGIKYRDVKPGEQPRVAQGDQAKITVSKQPEVPVDGETLLDKAGNAVKNYALDELFLKKKALGITPSNPATNLREAKIIEDRTDTVAKIITAPIRFTAGSLASATVAGALEKANSDAVYTPKTDAEKLLIGDQPIKRIYKADDLYGTIARTAGTPVAIALAAFLENPFIAGTGIGAGVKSGIKKMGAKLAAKEGEKVAEKMLAKEELIKLVEDNIDELAQAGKMTPEQVGQAITEVEKLKTEATRPVIDLSKAKPEEVARINGFDSNTLDAYTAHKVKADEAFPEFTESFNKIKSSGKLPPVQKGDTRAILKGVDEYGGDFAKIGDMNRGTYIVKNTDEAKKVIEDIQKEFKIVRTKDRIINPTSAGYRDVMINVEMKNGTRAEIQVNFPEMLKAKDKAHPLYEASRAIEPKIENLTATADEIANYQKLIQKQKDIYDKAWSKITKEKPKPIVYKKVELPVQKGNKRLKYESTLGTPSVPKRLEQQAIENDLTDAFKGISEYDKVSKSEQALKVKQIMDFDPEHAVRIALGKELPTNGALPESVFIAVKNQAIKERNVQLLRELAMEEGGVARGATILGQRIKMLDEGIQDDAFKQIARVAKNREKYYGEKVAMESKKLTEKLKTAVKEAKPNKYEWSNLIKEITCK